MIERTDLTPVSPCLSIHNVTLAQVSNKSISILISIVGPEHSESKAVKTLALIDSGAGGVFIDQRFAQKLNLPFSSLEEPIIVHNVDGTKNKTGLIHHFVNVDTLINDRITNIKMYVTGLGRQKIILGFPWLQDFNPIIDWKQGTLRWMEEGPRWDLTNEEIDESLVISYIGNEMTSAAEEIWINAKFSQSMLMSQKYDEKKTALTAEEIVPKEFHDYLSVFSEKESQRFPKSNQWDHEIVLKEGFKPKPTHVYPMPPIEEEALKKFIDENLSKGYIRKSKSPMASPFFYVGKKDGKLRPCQDYRYLNDWTVKNAYGLHHIDGLINKLKGAKYFTKMDMRWGYNNVRIKKGDEWKAAFKTKFGLFEPTVMFFGLCNAPATFQAMMDALLEELVDEGHVIVYMDDILIFAETREELRKITKRVLKVLKDNDLFLKPEKCEFEKTKVDYLGFIIEEGKVCMDPSKVKGILDWPQPQTVKQLRSFLGFGNFYR